MILLNKNCFKMTHIERKDKLGEGAYGLSIREKLQRTIRR